MKPKYFVSSYFTCVRIIYSFTVSCFWCIHSLYLTISLCSSSIFLKTQFSKHVFNYIFSHKINLNINLNLKLLSFLTIYSPKKSLFQNTFPRKGAQTGFNILKEDSNVILTTLICLNYDNIRGIILNIQQIIWQGKIIEFDVTNASRYYQTINVL